MANIPVITSPNGVWPAETASVDEDDVAAVTNSVLRLPIGEIHEMRSQLSAADMAEKVTHEAVKITTELVTVDATEGDDGVTFTVEYTGDPEPEVRWYGIQSGVSTLYVDDDTDVDIATTTGSSVLTLNNLVLEQDATTVRAEVRNYKGAAASEAALTVAGA